VIGYITPSLTRRYLFATPASTFETEKTYFEEIPEVLSQCLNLKIVSFKSNQIASVGEQALPQKLRWLILTNNKIEKLPTSLGSLSYLQKLMLAGNRLQSLPESMASCKKLELIRLSANQLTRLPPWLFSLPRLSWLAYAGNPLCNRDATLKPVLKNIDWAELMLGETLGQGASGVIYQGLWTRPCLQVIVDLTSLEKRGKFKPFDSLISVLDGKRGLHLVVLYLVVGDWRVPWNFRVFRGKGTTSPAQLGLRLVRRLPKTLTRRFQVMVLADTGFGSIEFLQGIRKLRYHAVVGVRCDRKLVDGRKVSSLYKRGQQVRLYGLHESCFHFLILSQARRQMGETLCPLH
jgi:hypothetical protein